MIRLEGVRKTYRDGDTSHQVLAGVDLDVAHGEFLAVLGHSGSGKSTLLNIVGGLDTDYEGRVEVGGERLAGLSDVALSAYRRRKVAFVFQAFNLIPELSALQNVLVPGWFDPAPADDAADRRRALEALERVGLSGKTDRRPDRLSGGERQRVALARALFSRPELLLCDEPTGNLDATTGAEVIDLFRELHRQGLTLLLVTHETRASRVADRVVRLREGRLVPASSDEGAL